jgi:hypothetical protein
MKKLSTLLAIVAMTAGLGVAGCKKKTEQTKEPAAAKTTDEKGSAEVAKPDEKKPEEKKEATPPADLPAECGEYKTAIDKVATCDKLPQATRDALKQSYDQTSASWVNIPAEGKAALGTACKSAADAIKSAAAAACGW